MTNMSTNKKRRAPGGGRKPKGPFAGNTERINVRCTPAIKDRLEIAAAENGRSLPQEIQERLERTFAEDTDQGRDPATAGLLWLVELAASQFVRGWDFAAGQFIGGGQKDLPTWRTDPGEFEGFKAAIDRILERLRPAGDVRTAPDVPNSPLNRARNIEWLIFDAEPLAARPKPMVDYYRTGRRGLLPDFPLGSSTQRSYEDFMVREEGRSAALRDLGLK
jgi:hypothetical protein